MSVFQTPHSHLRVEDVSSRLSILVEMFPQASYEFLRSKAVELEGQTQEAFASLIDELLVLGNYPPANASNSPVQPGTSFDPYANLIPSTSKEELGIVEIFHPPAEAICDNFDVVIFMDYYNQDPFKYFEELERDDHHRGCVAAYLKDKFKNIKSDSIESEVVLNDKNLTKAAESLLKPKPEDLLDKPRTSCEMDSIVYKPISFLREVQFYEHRQDIFDFLESQSLSRQVAKQQGDLLTCECCSEEEILPCDAMTCTDGHVFCRDCIKKYVEVRIGDDVNDFSCLQECTGSIPFKFIEKVLPVENFKKLMARIQEFEVRKANMSDVESCSACTYCVIPAPEDLVLKCANCGVETCRACGERTHVPFKCGETEKDDQVKQDRKKAEETLTMQVIRKCPKCRRQFVKDQGCDKITCSCGTTICYRCGRGGIDYNHFGACPARPSHSPW